MTVGGEFRRLRRRLVAIEYLRDCFAFVGRESRNEDQRPHSLLRDRTNHGAGIGMRDKDNRPVGPLQRSLKRRNIIR